MPDQIVLETRVVRNRVFAQKDAIGPADSVKNPVSLTSDASSSRVRQQRVILGIVENLRADALYGLRCVSLDDFHGVSGLVTDAPYILTTF